MNENYYSIKNEEEVLGYVIVSTMQLGRIAHFWPKQDLSPTFNIYEQTAEIEEIASDLMRKTGYINEFQICSFN